jgi:5-methyltetrahydropteroyltriglutamate--homocysteine methyltransferase
MEKILRTSVVGSYPQPVWLVDRERLKKHGVPRVGAPDIWRVPPEQLQEAQDDATRLAIADMEEAGIDIITDGEIRRESYSNRFLMELDGVDIQNPVELKHSSGWTIPIPRVIGPIRRRGPVMQSDMQFLRQHTACTAKITLPGPFTLAQQAHNEYYDDVEALAFAFAEAVNAEVLDLEAAGADVIQIDEPWLRNHPEAANRFGVAVMDRAVAGTKVTTATHLCFGYGFLTGRDKPRSYAFLEQLSSSTIDQISIEAAQPDLELSVLNELRGKTIMLGVLDLSSTVVETAEDVAARIRRGLRFVEADKLMPAPDCGLKYFSRDIAFAKLKALAGGAAIVRRELAG